MGNGTDTAGWRTLAAELATNRDCYERLLRLHADAGNGRCRHCTQPGTGTPRAPWPCPVHRLAADAQRIDRERRTGR